MAKRNRLDELDSLFETATASLAEVEPDKRAPLLREARAILAEIDALGGASAPKVEEVNGLVDFQKRLAERQPGADRKGRAAR